MREAAGNTYESGRGSITGIATRWIPLVDPRTRTGGITGYPSALRFRFPVPVPFRLINEATGTVEGGS